MNLKTIKARYLFALLLMAMFSCKKTDQLSSKNGLEEPSKLTALNKGESNYRGGVVILGKKLQNPYSVRNMELAFDTLSMNGINSVYSVHVRPTHYYVKFKPQTWEEYNDLESDTTLNLMDYPMDYEVDQEGNRYRDPSISDSLPSFQYTAVPVDFNFNDTIDHEILEELYIPENDESLLGTNEENESYVDDLLDQAFIQTHNFEDTVKETDHGRSEFFPAGHIEIFDSRLNQSIPLAGVAIWTRRWFDITTTHTDKAGNYQILRNYKRQVNYSLHFSTPAFSVRESLIGHAAWFPGPRTKDPWSFVINGPDHAYDVFAGTVFRAAYAYHYGNRDKLQYPLYMPARMLFVAKDSNSEVGDLGTNSRQLPKVTVYRYLPDHSRQLYSDEVFATTIHEMAHLSHWTKIGINYFLDTDEKIRESWAEAVAWRLTSIEYKSLGIVGFGEWNYAPSLDVRDPILYGFQYWKNTDDKSRVNTNLFINLFDNFNEWGFNFINRGQADVWDDITGYKMQSLELWVYQSRFLIDIEVRLKQNKPPLDPSLTPVTNANLDLLLSKYQ